MSTLLDKANAIKEDKDTNLLPENLRSGITCLGIEGTLNPDGYDLTKIGTTVTASAETTLLRGDKWEGVPNSSFTASISEVTASALDIYASNDMMVSIPSSGNGYTSITTKFYDVLNNSYVNVTTNIRDIWDSFNVDTSRSVSSQLVINEEGTLIVMVPYLTSMYGFTGNNKFIVFEVDKENQTVTPYVFTSAFTRSNASNILLVSGNDIFLKETPSSGSTRNIHHYSYDISTHTISDYYVTNNLNGTIVDELFNTSVTKYVRKNDTLLAVTGNRLIRSVLYSDRLEITYTTGTSGHIFIGIEDNHSYILDVSTQGSDSATLYVGQLNPLDLTISNRISLSNVKTDSNGTYGYMSGNKILVSNKIYYFDGSTITELVSSTNTNLAKLNSRGWNTKLWGCYTSNNSNSNKLFSLIESNGQYVVHPYSGQQTTVGKYYGIASENIAIGEIGKVQLLFSADSE